MGLYNVPWLSQIALKFPSISIKSSPMSKVALSNNDGLRYTSSFPIFIDLSHTICSINTTFLYTSVSLFNAFLRTVFGCIIPTPLCFYFVPASTDSHVLVAQKK